MRYIICAVAILYAVLSMLAAVVFMRTAKRKDTSIMMLGGGILFILAAILQKADWILATVGGILICASAFMNGKRSGDFHARHHIIRFVLTLLLVLGFIWK